MKNRIRVKVKDLIEGILNNEIKYKTIEYGDEIYNYNKDEKDYTHKIDDGYEYYDYLFDDIHAYTDSLVDVYNTDVIAIENKKIEKISGVYGCKDPQLGADLLSKVNEIIDNLNENEGE